jgi:hypothetical protein
MMEGSIQNTGCDSDWNFFRSAWGFGIIASKRIFLENNPVYKLTPFPSWESIYFISLLPGTNYETYCTDNI